MKFYLSTLFLFTVCLVALPTSMVRACADAGAGIEQQTKASSQVGQEHCASANADDCISTHPGQECPPDTDGCGHCHCPGCGSTAVPSASFFKNTLVEISTPIWPRDTRAANFYYQTPLTAAHLTALFQPPRI